MISIEWFAGLFEGEGSFSIRKDNYERYGYERMIVQIKSTDEDVIDSIMRIALVGKKNGPYAYKKNPTYKPYWQWSVTRRTDCILMAAMLGPYLHSRRLEQLQTTLHHVDEHCLDKHLDEWKRKLIAELREQERAA